MRVPIQRLIKSHPRMSGPISTPRKDSAMADATFIAFGDAAKKSEMRMLPQALQAGETPICAIYGSYSINFGLLVATDKRIFFLSKTFRTVETESFRYEDLSEVEWDTGFMGGNVTFRAHGKAYKVTQPEKKDVRYFARYLKARVAHANKKHPRYLPATLKVRRIARMIEEDIDPILNDAVADGAKSLRLSELAQQKKR